MAEKPSGACVIGAGIIGSWTALHLAQVGVPTLLIEQFPLPHTRGSSHGGSRVIRLLGDDHLAALEYSYAQWRQLERQSGQQLLVNTGLINLGPPGDAYLAKYTEIVRGAGYSVGSVTAEQLEAKYPFLKYPGLGAASDPSGGVLLASSCVSAVQREFVRLGGSVLNARVEQLEECADSVKVTARSLGGAVHELRFNKAAVCAGVWSRRLVSQCAHLLSSQSIPVTYWRERGHQNKHSVASGCPVVFNARMANIYALPSFEYPGLTKVLVHSGPAAEPDARDAVEMQPIVDYVSEYIKEHMPLLDHTKPAIVESCMYTMTPDSKPLIDLVSSNIAIGTGYSGSGFKHSPASGRMIAALLLGTESELPEGFNLSSYRISRFEEGKAHSLKDAGRLLDTSGRSML